MTDRPTFRQVEAVRLVYYKGLTQEQAGVFMGISKQAVGRLIKRARAINPYIVPKSKPRGKILSFDDTRDYIITKQF